MPTNLFTVAAGADVVRHVPGLWPPPRPRDHAVPSTPHPVLRWARPAPTPAPRSRLFSSSPPFPPHATQPGTPRRLPPRRDGRATAAGELARPGPSSPAPSDRPRRASTVATCAVPRQRPWRPPAAASVPRSPTPSRGSGRVAAATSPRGLVVRDLPAMF